ncbi:MAG: HAD family hydrolase [Cohaesibacter sp.]|jgi:phosphoglycolate phosphatase|nr:HAD family hydrolase [Cohaesibacter sp.]
MSLSPLFPSFAQNQIKGVLFDRDGTLLDLQKTWAGAFYYMIREMAREDEDKIRQIADYSGYLLESRSFDMTSRLLTGAPSDYCPRWAEICERPYGDEFIGYFTDLSLKYCDVSPTFLPGAQEALRALKDAGIPLGIATNGTESSARRQMASLTIEEDFCFVAGYDSGYGAKPEPGQILAFAEHLGCEASDILMVGDSLHDIHAGKAAGCLTMGVPTGACTQDELAADADQVLPSLADLPLALGLSLPASPAQPRPMRPGTEL